MVPGRGELLLVEGQSAVIVENRDEAAGEPTLGERYCGAGLARLGEFVALFTREAFDGSDQVGRDALGDHRELFEQMSVVGCETVDVHRRGPRHGLDPATDHEVLVAGEDAHRSKGDGLLPRTAEAVEGDARRVEGPARVEGGHASDIHRVIAASGPTPHDHVVDLGGVEADPVTKTVEDLGEDALRVHVVECAGFLAFASRRPYGIDDQGFAFHSCSFDATGGRCVAYAILTGRAGWSPVRSRS